MKNIILNNKINSWLLVLAFIAVMTPYYALGYLLMCIYGARVLRFIRALDTFFANFILTFMILCASIMITGVFTSYFRIPNLAVINLVVALLFTVILMHLQRGHVRTTSDIKLFDGTDLASVFAAIIIPGLSLVLMASSLGISGSAYRIAAMGAWDGVQHFSFLQVDSAHNNYIFDSSPIKVDGEDISNNYPQGWHLASSDIANGIYPGVFNTAASSMKKSLIGYMLVVFVWYFLVIYMIIRFVAYLLPRPRSTVARCVFLTIAVQFIAVTVLEPMWSVGFVNYIGLLSFIVLAVMYTYQAMKDGDDILLYLATTSIIMAAVGLMWVLPVAFVFFLVCLVILTISSKPRLARSRVVAMLVPVSMSTASLLIYVLLLIGGLDVGRYLFVTPGWQPEFPSGTTGLVCCGVVLLAACYVKKIEISKYAYILTAFILPLSMIYFVSYLKLKDTGYYQVKLYGIVFLVISIFTITAIIRISESIRASNFKVSNHLLGAGILVSSIGAIFIFSGQSMYVRMMHKDPQYASVAEEKLIINFAYNTHDPKEQAVVLNKDMVATQVNGSGLFNRRTSDVSAEFISVRDLNHRPDTCLVYVFFDMTTSTEDTSKNSSYSRLSDCIRVRNSTGYKTTVFVPRDMMSDISNIDIQDARVVYF